ncbi:MAG: FimV/HubP family polar landmark protein [Burkholderiaceae bacterium]
MKRKFPQSRRLASSVALALATLSVGGVQAAGLGRLTVQSGLGQPLRAEVEVTSLGRDESPSLSVKLASPDAFKQAGLEYSPSLSNLRFAIDRRPDGRAAVRISSAQPLNEPFVDLLIELNWATGKFVREYTFLLDPPEMKVGGDASQQTAAPVVPPAIAASSDGAASAGQAPDPAALAASARAGGRARSGEAPGAPALARSRDAAARPAPAQPAADASTSAGAPATAGGTVAVRQGETLAAIASRVKPSEVTMEQAIIAIYRANPDAFFGSVHQLRSGTTLSVPDAGAMSAIDDKLARAEIRAQMANFNQYKARMAAAARGVEGERAGQSVSGSVSGSVTDRSAPGLDSDQLKLSKSGGGAAGAGNSVAASDAEREVASEAAAREAQGRVHELEKSVADLRRLLELKDKQLADLQATANAARAGASAASGAAAPAVAAAGSPSTAAGSLSPSAAAADAVAAATSATQSNSPAATPSQSSSAAAPVSSGPSADAQPPAMPAASPAPAAAAAAAAAASSPAAVEPKPVAVEPKPVAAPPVVSAPAPAEPGLFDELSDNPLVLPGLAAIVALIAGSAWVAMRRRKKVEKFEDSLIAPDGFAANSLFGSTGGQTSVDTHNSLFTASRETTSDVHSTEVDPIAEAEVYIAYGREAQAEEILKEALKKQPERQAIRLKLMEIYAGRKDAKLFGQVAADMHEMTGGLNEEWPKVVTLGLSLDPDNPLYAGKGGAAPAAPTPVAASFEAAHAELPAIEAEASAPLSNASGAAAAAVGMSAAAAASLATRDIEARRADDGLDFSIEPPAFDAPKPDDVAALDFDLDLDRALNEASASPTTTHGDEVSALSQAIGGRFELPSLDLPSRTAPSTSALPVSGETATLQDDDLKIDLPAFEDFDTQAGRQADSAAAPAAMDLSAIGLDLQPSTMTPPPSADAARWQEMATKLDLASAYEEIGDNEGARELLQEVLKGGDNDQQQRAQLMLSKIS